jgi:light-regulated signal transduction histidine kinase (bacteriophytochrome)
VILNKKPELRMKAIDLNNGDHMNTPNNCVRDEAYRNIEKHLDQLQKEKEEILYIVSHDLQEPFRIIASFLQLLVKRNNNKLDKESQEFIGFAVDGAERMTKMLNGLLELSRLDCSSANFTSVNLGKVIKFVCRQLQNYIELKNAEVICEPLPVVMANEKQMILLFTHLLDNALKFSTGKNPKINVLTEQESENWKIMVCDKGLGIPQQHQDRIFSIFQRLHARDVYKGIGIGLALCKKIISIHGGKIWVESGSGQGSRFIFTLPRNNAGNGKDIL